MTNKFLNKNCDLSEKEELLINALFDGELSKRQEQDLRECLKKGSNGFNRDEVSLKFQQLHDVRSSYRAWHEEALDGLPKISEDIFWENILEKIKEPHQSTEFKQTFFSQIQAQLQEFFGSLRVAPAMGGAFAIMLAVFLTTNANQSTTGKIAKVSNEQNIFQSTEFGNASVLASASQTNVGESVPLTESDALRVGKFSASPTMSYQNKLPQFRTVGSHTRRALSSQYELAQQMREELNDEIASVDWISSDREIRIVPTEDKSVAPVIWVANRGR
jgi:hypothetical protein